MTVVEMHPSFAMAVSKSGSSSSVKSSSEESFHPSVVSDLLDGVLCDDELNGMFINLLVACLVWIHFPINCGAFRGHLQWHLVLLRYLILYFPCEGIIFFLLSLINPPFFLLLISQRFLNYLPWEKESKATSISLILSEISSTIQITLVLTLQWLRQPLTERLATWDFLPIQLQSLLLLYPSMSLVLLPADLDCCPAIFLPLKRSAPALPKSQKRPPRSAASPNPRPLFLLAALSQVIAPRNRPLTLTVLCQPFQALEKNWSRRKVHPRFRDGPTRLTSRHPMDAI